MLKTEKEHSFVQFNSPLFHLRNSFFMSELKKPSTAAARADTHAEEFAEIDDKVKAVFDKKGYQLQCKVGSGAFGQVYKAVNVKRDNLPCAVKVMDMTKMSSKLRDKFLPREIAALIEVKHPNAVRVYDIFKMSKKVFIFMEFAGNGDLNGYLKKNKEIKEDLAVVWFRQVSEAVNYLHVGIRMSHRDIKLDNILLNEANETKLSDFGFASLLADDDSNIYEAISETYCGSPPYYSPQLVAKKPYNPFKSDVWACGVVLFCMLNCRFPFHFKSMRSMYKEQTDFPDYIRGRFSEANSPAARDLIEKTVTPSESDRPTMADVLKHDWFKVAAAAVGCEVLKSCSSGSGAAASEGAAPAE